MFLSENNYQLPRRAQTWSGWSALSQKLNHTAVNAVGSCYWIFAHVYACASPAVLVPAAPVYVYLHIQGAGVTWASGGSMIKAALIYVSVAAFINSSKTMSTVVIITFSVQAFHDDFMSQRIIDDFLMLAVAGITC